MMPAKSSFRVILCAAAFALAAPAAAQPREISLEETLRVVFERSPAFHVYAARTRAAVGTRMRAAGAFDVVATTSIEGQRTLWPSATSYGILGDEGYSDLFLRAGLGMRTRQNIDLQLTGSIPLVSTIDPTTSADQPQLTANLTLPLLKFGHSAGSAAEARAADLHATATAALQRDDESAFVARVVETYFRWVGGMQQLEWARRLEALAADQLSDVDQLIGQHARAAVDRLAFAAAAHNAAARRFQAETVALQQQQALWETIGVPSSVDAVPRGELPKVPPPQSDGDAIARRAQETAATRPLMRALTDEREAASVRREAARIGKRPDLNLVAQGTLTRIAAAGPTLTTTAIVESTTAQPTELGYYGLAALQLSFPLQNRTARGTFEEAAANETKAILDDAQGRGATRARIDALASAVASLRQSYQAHASAADEYRRSYEAQRTRFRLGTATVMDVIVAEEQYMNASLAVVADQISYSAVLARLIHEAGLLAPAVQARDPSAITRALTAASL